MKKFITMMLALMMILGMTTVSFAETQTTAPADQSKITFKVDYQATNAGTVSPAETFVFGTWECEGVADAGVGITIGNAPMPSGTVEVAFAKNAADQDDATTGTATVNLPTYTAVGTYTYTFKQKAGNTAGVTYHGDDIQLVVTVLQGENGLIRTAAIKTTSEGKSDEIENTYSAGALTVTKNVTGYLGDRNKDFTVTVKFTAPADKPVKSDITYTSNKKEGTTNISAEDGWTTKTVVITLKHEETITFTNIPYGVTYAVEEADYTGEGYDAAAYEFGDANEKIDTASDAVTITNNKGGSAATGILLDNGLYVLILAGVAAAAGVFFVRRRRQREDF